MARLRWYDKWYCNECGYNPARALVGRGPEGTVTLEAQILLIDCPECGMVGIDDLANRMIDLEHRLGQMMGSLQRRGVLKEVMDELSSGEKSKEKEPPAEREAP